MYDNNEEREADSFLQNEGVVLDKRGLAEDKDGFKAAFNSALYKNILMLSCLYFLLFSKSWMLVELKLFYIHIHNKENIYQICLFTSS